MFVTVSPYHPSLLVVVRKEPTRVELLTGLHSKGRLLASPPAVKYFIILASACYDKPKTIAKSNPHNFEYSRNILEKFKKN